MLLKPIINRECFTGTTEHDYNTVRAEYLEKPLINHVN